MRRLKDGIPLSAEQIAAIESIFQRMRQEAIEEGQRLIAGERALDEAFHARRVTKGSLRRMLADILSAHLYTIAIVSEQQIGRYNALRGCGPNPCSNVPAGHGPAMWRKHIGCE